MTLLDGVFKLYLPYYPDIDSCEFFKKLSPNSVLINGKLIVTTMVDVDTSNVNL